MIGNGVVVDPKELPRDRGLLPEPRQQDLASDLSQRAPHHALPPDVRRRRRGEAASSRSGPRARASARATPTRRRVWASSVQDLLVAKILKRKIEATLEAKRPAIERSPRNRGWTCQKIPEEKLTFGHGQAPYIVDTVRLVQEWLDAGQGLCSRARRARRRPRPGTYPFVTSSSPVAGAAASERASGPKEIEEVWA